ncbi:MAG: hypothetical protein WCP21_01835 [Armatimonadota bacterium]
MGDADIALLLQQGRKIEALKLYRERTGVGLAEAKEAVEAMETGQELPVDRTIDPAWEAELTSLLERGQKIEAIKLYRQHHPVGLQDAKEIVEAIAAEHGIVGRSGSGCLGAALMMVPVCLLALAMAKG